MSNEVATQKNFQDRMVNKIRESIGDLMTDDELKKIIERGVDEVFFKEHIVQEGFQSIHKPPWLCIIVKELLSEKVEKYVAAFLANRTVDVEKVIYKTVQEGVGMALIKTFTDKFQCSLDMFKSDIESRLTNGGF
jgi:hypothetical protein